MQKERLVTVSKVRGMDIVNMHIHAMSRQTPSMVEILVRDTSLSPVPEAKG